MTAAEELALVRGEAGALEPPPGFEVDRQTYQGGPGALARARQVMTSVLTEADLPLWFVELCVDDTHVQTCNLNRWSVRAWRFWLQPDNRRWWWWEAAAAGDEVQIAVLVRARPYLKGSLDWLFKAAALPA